MRVGVFKDLAVGSSPDGADAWAKSRDGRYAGASVQATMPASPCFRAARRVRGTEDFDMGGFSFYFPTEHGQGVFRIDQLVGAGRWQACGAVGTFPIDTLDHLFQPPREP